jgi:hypothetical protein
MTLAQIQTLVKYVTNQEPRCKQTGYGQPKPTQDYTYAPRGGEFTRDWIKTQISVCRLIVIDVHHRHNIGRLEDIVDIFRRVGCRDGNGVN